MTSFETKATKNENIRLRSHSQIPAIPFTVPLPDSSALPGIGGQINAIIGSIILLRNSAIIWVGNGKLGQTSSPSVPAESAFGKGAPTMGQFVVAMPRTRYSGSFGTGSDSEPSCSQLIGSESSEDQMLASQMASRLSMRSGMAVFVSCQLSSSSRVRDEQDLLAGLDSETMSHRAAALAEKEIWRILKDTVLKERKG